MKKTKISDFLNALFKKLSDKQKKNTFLLFFNYLKTETEKNSEKNYTNLSLNARCSYIFRKNLYSNVNNKKTFFLNKLIF